MGYLLIRPFIHLLPPESAHALGLWALGRALIPPARLAPDPMLSQTLLGLEFPHPLGLAAGFDKNAEALAPLARQGFSFVEAGTVTPRPQEGNAKPRMFRLSQDRAVINRLGFNNGGVEAFAARLADREKTGVVGANIGKNKDAEDAIGDYLTGYASVYPYADYVTINISSPNTQGLRSMQKREQLTQLLEGLLGLRATLAPRHRRQVPLLLKIAPDLDAPDLEDVAEVALALNIDGVIVSNTTIKRPRTLKSKLHGEQGGLSGEPLFALSTDMLSRFYALTGGRLVLVGAGGVGNARQAYAKIRAGASLVQLYTALVYQGFGVVPRIVEELPRLLERDGFTHLSQAVGADHR